ncbi:MAG: CRISPR-associated protein Csx15 [Anaerolineae bacterium]|nr:CRISPR-associated protein Csx15 [Anaerolineae bacterium]
MILLNFSHPLTPDHLTTIETLTKNTVAQVVDLPIHFEHGQPFQPQLQKALEAVTLSPQEWQTAGILVNLPSFNYIAAMTLAELHGRMGYFPPILRMRPVEDAIPPRFEVAEVVNLQALRDAARKERY